MTGKIFVVFFRSQILDDVNQRSSTVKFSEQPITLQLVDNVKPPPLLIMFKVQCYS
jgi:hypothetical protein